MSGRAAVEPGDQEATRLLCAGVYADYRFRRRVIEELVEHEERPVAPSLGCDVLPVLAHALRARRWEAVTGVAVLLVWTAFALVGGREAVPFAAAWVLLWGARLLWNRRTPNVFDPGRAESKELPLQAIAFGALFLVSALNAVVFFLVKWAGLDRMPVWHWVLFPLLLAVPVWAHRTRQVVLMRRELSREGFAAGPPLKLPGSGRYRRIGEAIAREQFSPLAPYPPVRPLIGFGLPYDAWSFALELRPVADGAAVGGRLTNRDVLDLIRPQVASLRLSGQGTGRDRLRRLKVDECVCRPVDGPRRELPYATDRLRESLREAVDGDGERSRHFLRVRITAWDGQLVVTVLVRVHTQGGMLVLEVSPHVLPPVRDDFAVAADAASEHDRLMLRNTLRALFASPAASTAAVVSLLRTAVAVSRTWLRRSPSSRPGGPQLAVRELAAAEQVTFFQEMDISRYVKTVQDRVKNGVLEALRAKGYDTQEFEQQTVNIGRGAIYVGRMSGGVAATGERTEIHYTSGDGNRHGTHSGERRTAPPQPR
ncbi:hypothetical protein [Streptomyces sp. BBFR2]|uniref:hypothetical protein n=1 Tax=Streptomyces sp. BBFR2 TaxID=3372854 RepID=UPI0037D9FD34